MRLAYYAGASTAAAAGCLLKAFHQRPNFYSATVYLSQSNACLLILTNLLLVLTCSFIYALQRALYGPLRPIEIEQLSEKAWYAVLDTLLAMPSFREDVGGWLLCMFVLLLAGKVWGWIGEGRVDILEQGQPIPQGTSKKWFHIRLATSLVLSVAFDVGMLNYCVESVMADPRPGMMVIFTFEFAVLAVFSIFTFSRYLLSLMQAQIEAKQMLEALETRKQEIRAERAAARQQETADGRPAPASPPDEEPIEVDENEVDVPGWEEKRRYLFFLEVLTDFVKLVIYIVFFTVSVTFNGLPMHIMRDVYMTFASFSKRVSDFVAYRKATSDMNTRYPDATTEEIRGDACIVCRETMVAWEQPAAAQAADQPAAPAQPQARRDEGLRAKKLPCGHILHLRCLKAWLERQQVCPTCRRPVIQAPEAAAGVPGQPGAVPGNGAVGAPGAPQGGPGGARPLGGRARIFNFGPLRVGFLNGPGDQIQQVINQMRNPQAPGQAGAQGVDAAQQGPNHLGLQVPYLPGAAGVPAMAARAAVPTQVQLMQIEQRIIQEAHNLGVEQQQLATLRIMEAELARLRTLHIPGQRPVGMAGAAQRQVLQFPAPSGLFAQPAPLPYPQHHAAAMPQQETLHGNPSQTMGAGHESLPQVMPLHRNHGVMPAAGQGTQQPPIQTTTNSQPHVDGTVPQHHSHASSPTPVAAQATSSVPSHTDQGPTDDRGSPLFTPAAAAASSTPQAGPSAPGPSMQSAEPSSQQSQGPAAPWSSSNGGWGFDGSSVNDQNSGEAMSNAQAQEEQGEGGKGKGRAVEVEDAKDDEVL
ncbi:E3 ubiquitin-protein ligase hrd1 [Recurvomyces mirabilis]|nr:E3 ubiquitin-protein ligase hrd1 [Recurvomyces mirabilis]